MNLEKLVTGALSDLDLASRVSSSLPSRLARPITIIAIGKAAPEMARGALDRVAAERCIVVCPDGTPAPRGIEVLRAGHPMPDRRSMRAAERCLEIASEATGTLLVLVSGGASALVCAPADGIDLATKRAVTQALLRSGASVQDINVVRKHLSRIKGGGLARAAKNARVVTLVASDVIGGTASDVGSGPSVGDPSSVADARRILRRFAPRYASLPLVRTLDRGGRAVIVASPEQLASRVASLLGARVLAPSQADAESLAREYVAFAKRGLSVVRAAEPSLVVRGKGRGGRCTHIAAVVGRDLPRGATFLALATDGVDGASGTAGAIVRAGFADRDGIDRALARFATGDLHRAAGTAIPSRASGHNLADLHVLRIR